MTFISNKLAEYGLQVGFFNFAKTEIRIMIPIINEEHYNEKKKTTNIKGHLFIIGPKGSVELYSKGDPNEAIKIGLDIIFLIKNIIESNEYNEALNGNPIFNNS